MLKKSITSTNLDGQEVTEDFYFHLTKAELIKFQIQVDGGFAEGLQKIATSNDAGLIIDTFEKILRAAYGVRTPDGRFVKRASDWEAFVSSEAYSELFMELVTNGVYAAEFVKAIMPGNMGPEAEKALAGITTTADLPQTVGQVIDQAGNDVSKPPAWVMENRSPEDEELRGAPDDLILLAMKWRLEGR